MKRLILLFATMFIGIVMTGLTVNERVQGRTIYFDQHMIASKNLTNNGVIQYHITGDANKYKAEVTAATDKWNHALGKKVFVKARTIGESRLVITNAQVTAGMAGIAEINSGVIALNGRILNHYTESKRQAVLIHELGHALGTKDLYLYPQLQLRSLFKQKTIMGGDYSTHIGKFDADLAKWSLKHTAPMSNSEFNNFRHNPQLYFQKYVV